jgi:periplasmic divalent cation tolerance protein
MGDPEVRILLTSLDDEPAAALLARALVEERLAACVNVVPGAHSIYRWKGAVETARECLLVIKTTAAAAPRVAERLRALHPYELPEIVTLATDSADAAYARWVAESVDAEPAQE